MLDPSPEVRLSGQPRWSQQQIQIMNQFRTTQSAQVGDSIRTASSFLVEDDISPVLQLPDLQVQVESLLALVVEDLEEEEAMDRFYHEVSTPLQVLNSWDIHI